MDTGGGHDPSLSDRLGQPRIQESLRPTHPRRTELGDDPIPIRHQHRLPGGGQPNVFGQFVLQDLDSDGAHFEM